MQISNGMKFTRADFWKAVIAGGAIALLIMPVLKNLGVLNFIQGWGVGSIFLLFLFWIFFMPAVTVAGLYLFYLVAVKKWPIVFQIGKYGIVGWLNTFLFAGIMNFLIWITGVVEGLTVDGFAIVAFVVTTVSSFCWNKFWTFDFGHSAKTKQEYVKFFAVSAVMSLINTCVIHVFVNIIGAPQNIDAKIWVNIVIAITIPIAFFGNFLGYRIFVFKDKKVE